MEEKLVWIDEHYLSRYEYLEVDSSISRQKPFACRKERIVDYPILAGESVKKQAYLSYHAVIGDSLDPELYLAFQVLEYALLSAPGAQKGQGNRYPDAPGLASAKLFLTDFSCSKHC